MDENVDLARLLKMIVIRDLVETEAGDVSKEITLIAHGAFRGQTILVTKDYQRSQDWIIKLQQPLFTDNWKMIADNKCSLTNCKTVFHTKKICLIFT